MRAGRKEPLLDELVIDVKAQEARALSEAGAVTRVDFLVARLGAAEAASALGARAGL
jgi:hypothetical protein